MSQPYSLDDYEDYKYFDNKPVNDLLFDIYMGILQLDCMDPEPDDYEERIDIFANAIRARMDKLLPEEQNYIKRKITGILGIQEDKSKTLEKRKEND